MIVHGSIKPYWILMHDLAGGSTHSVCCELDKIRRQHNKRYEKNSHLGGSTASAHAIVHFGSVGRLCGLFERSKAT